MWLECSVLFYSELKQKNATLRERYANWRSSEKKSLEGNQQLTLGGELVRGAELSCCRSCCDVWLGVDGGVKLAVKSSSTPWDDCRSAAGRAAGGQVPTQQTPANYRTIKAKTIKNIWIRELDYLDKICLKMERIIPCFFSLLHPKFRLMIDHHTSCRVLQRHLGGWHTLSHLPDTSVHFEEEQLSSSDTWSVREVCRLHSTSDIRLETKDGKKFDTSIWSRRRQSHSLISQLITDQSSWSSLWSLRNFEAVLRPVFPSDGAQACPNFPHFHLTASGEEFENKKI